MKLDPAVMTSVDPIDVFRPSRSLALLFGLGVGALSFFALLFVPPVRGLGGSPFSGAAGLAVVPAVVFFLWRSWGRTAVSDEMLVVNGEMFRWSSITRIEEECTSGEYGAGGGGYGAGGGGEQTFRFAVHVTEDGASRKVVLPRAARSDVLREELLKRLTPAALEASSLDAVLPLSMR